MLNVYQLRIFVAVAENRKFSLAAERLHLTQPAVSQQIRSLEKYLGVPLFQRNGQKVEITESGLTLLPLARELIELALLAEEQIQHSRGLVAGKIVFGTSTEVGKYLFPKLMAAFRKRHPQVQTLLVLTDHRQLLKRIEDREVDFGIVAGRPGERNFAIHPLYEDELVVIVPSKHALSKKTSINFAELVPLPLVLQREQADVCQTFRGALTSRGLSLDALNVVLEVDNAESAHVAVEAGAGVAVTSRSVFQRFAGKVRALEFDESLTREIFLVGRQRMVQSPIQQRFVDFLESDAGKKILGVPQ